MLRLQPRCRLQTLAVCFLSQKAAALSPAEVGCLFLSKKAAGFVTCSESEPQPSTVMVPPVMVAPARKYEAAQGMHGTGDGGHVEIGLMKGTRKLD